MPLSAIAEIAAKPRSEAAKAVGEYWAHVESVVADRRALASYIQAKLTGGEMPTYDIQTRTVPERKVLSINRHLYANETDAFFDEAFARLRSAAPGIEGIAGCPFLVFYGDVSDDSDGPMELCRPVAHSTIGATSPAMADVQLRVESAHDEVFIRLAMKDIGWPAMAPAVDAIEAWAREQRREPAGPLRQVLIADQRSATPDTLVCDLTVPLKVRSGPATAAPTIARHTAAGRLTSGRARALRSIRRARRRLCRPDPRRPRCPATSGIPAASPASPWPGSD